MWFKNFFQFRYLLLFIFTLLLAAKYFFENECYKKELKPEIVIGNAQWKGSRKRQEDSFSTIKNENGILALVADGMGGLASGKKASKLTARTFLEEFSRTYDIQPVSKFLINTCYLSNARILKAADGRKIGTTLAAVLVSDGYLHWVSVGDSQIYLYRRGELIFINERHIFANQLRKAYQAGEISRHEVLNHPKRGRLTSYLGYDEFHKLDYSKSPVELKPKDKIVLCSDGIYEALSEQEMKKLLAKSEHPMKICQLMLERIKSKNIEKQDNATVVVLKTAKL